MDPRVKRTISKLEQQKEKKDQWKEENWTRIIRNQCQS